MRSSRNCRRRVDGLGLFGPDLSPRPRQVYGGDTADPCGTKEATRCLLVRYALLSFSGVLAGQTAVFNVRDRSMTRSANTGARTSATRSRPANCAGRCNSRACSAVAPELLRALADAGRTAGMGYCSQEPETTDDRAATPTRPRRTKSRRRLVQITLIGLVQLVVLLGAAEDWVGSRALTAKEELEKAQSFVGTL